MGPWALLKLNVGCKTSDISATTLQLSHIAAVVQSARDKTHARGVILIKAVEAMEASILDTTGIMGPEH